MNLRVYNALRKVAGSPDDNPYSGIARPQLAETAGSTILSRALDVPDVPLAGAFGYMQSIDDDEKLARDLNNPSLLGILPGMNAYRSNLRDRLVDRKVSGGKVDRKAQLSETGGSLLAPILATLAATGVGAGIGALNDGGIGALRGGVVGASVGLAGGLAATLAGLAYGLLKSRRTTAQHSEYLSDPNLIAKNLLIPGYSAYQTGSRTRAKWAAFRDTDTDKDKDKNKNKNKD